MDSKILTALIFSVLMVAGCAFTQKPTTVGESPSQRASAPGVKSVQGDPPPPGSASIVPVGLTLDKLPAIAKARQKNPTAIKQYAGQNLQGQAKFVKTAKGNPNVLVADVRVNGLGEVSIWCRNVLGAMPAGRTVGFDGVLTGEVYTSEDFSNDVYLKDCRFRD